MAKPNARGIEKQRIAATAAVAFRNMKPVQIKIAGLDGKTLRHISSFDLADALLRRADIELSIRDDHARLFCSCGAELKHGKLFCSQRCHGQAARKKTIPCSGCGALPTKATASNARKTGSYRCRECWINEHRAAVPGCSGCGKKPTGRHAESAARIRKQWRCRDCFKSSRAAARNISCPQCGASFERRNRDSVYCSHKCGCAARRAKTPICRDCGAKAAGGARNSAIFRLKKNGVWRCRRCEDRRRRGLGFVKKKIG